MSNYAVFFGYNNGKNVFRLPVNPEEIETTSKQNIETYEILKLGQIAVPTHMELKEYSFDCEFPCREYGYIETANKFENAEYYLQLFEEWRTKAVPFRFIAGRVAGESVESDSINSLVLIEEMSITEKAGEEGDKYVSFKLIEYREYGKKSIITKQGKKVTKKTMTASKKSPKSTGIYVVKRGDTLWSIAKKQYGNGSQYTKIYNANKDKIKNPNLIYPGQKLTIPD